MDEDEIQQLLSRLAERSRVPADAETLTVEHGDIDEERLELSDRQELSRWIKEHGGELGEYQVSTFGTFSGPGSEWVKHWKVPRGALA
jgi:hypothetical protein